MPRRGEFEGRHPPPLLLLLLRDEGYGTRSSTPTMAPIRHRQAGGGGEGFLPRRGEFEAPIRRAASGSPAPLPEGSPACGNRRCLLAPARLCLLAPARLCLLAPARRQSLRYATLHPPPLLLRLPPSRQSETEGRRLGAGASASPSHPPPAIPLLSRHWSGPPAWHPESWVEGNKEGEAGFQTSLP